MEHEDVERLEQLLAVQDEQMSSIRDTLRERERKVQKMETEYKALQKDYNILHQTLMANKQDIEEIKDKESVLHLDMHDKLNKQGASLLGLANKHLEGRDKELELLSFEVMKKERVISSLREEIRKREERIFDLLNSNSELARHKEVMETNKVASIIQYRTHADAKVALNTAQVNTLSNDKNNLMKKLLQMEGSLLSKDTEISSCHEQLHEKDMQITYHLKTVENLKFEINLLNLQLAEVTKAAKNRESELAIEIRKTKEQQEGVLRIELSKREDMIGRLNEDVSQLNMHIAGLNEKLDNTYRIVEEKNREKEEKESDLTALRQEVADAAAALQANDRSVEVELLRREETELKGRLAEQVDVLEALQQDSVLLQKTRVECASKDKEILDLRCTVGKLQHELSKSIPNDSSLQSHYRSQQRSSSSSNSSGSPRPPYSSKTAPLRSAVISSPSTVSQANNWSPNAYENTNIRGAHIYKTDMNDETDKAVCSLLQKYNADNDVSVFRIQPGIYCINHKRTNVKLVNGQLLVEVCGGVMSMADYIASERYSLALPISPKNYTVQDFKSTSWSKPQSSSSSSAGIDPFRTAIPIPSPQGIMPFKKI